MNETIEPCSSVVFNSNFNVLIYERAGARETTFGREILIYILFSPVGWNCEHFVRFNAKRQNQGNAYSSVPVRLKAHFSKLVYYLLSRE